MQKKGLETFLYSAAGVFALAIILVAVNYIMSPARARIDLTEGRVFTLSEGTRNILTKLEAPVKIRFYYTQGEATPVALKTFAQRVADAYKSRDECEAALLFSFYVKNMPTADVRTLNESQVARLLERALTTMRLRASTVDPNPLVDEVKLDYAHSVNGMLLHEGPLPLSGVKEIREEVEKAVKGASLSPQELLRVGQTARAGERAKPLAGSAPMSRPSKRMVPSLASIRRVTRRTTVDLPHPDSPTRLSVSPLRIAKSMPSTAFSIKRG
jgi:hypothetical protein